MRKKIVCGLLLLLLSAALAGCSADSQSAGQVNDEPKTLARVVSLDFDGEVWTKDMLEQGKLLAQNIGYADDDTVLWYINYEYGENGKIKTAWVYDPEGNLLNPEPEEDKK